MVSEWAFAYVCYALWGPTVLERAPVGTLYLSWGGSPCQLAPRSGERIRIRPVALPPMRGRLPWWGARPVESAVLERTRWCHRGAWQGSTPTHPGSSRQSALLGSTAVLGSVGLSVLYHLPSGMPARTFRAGEPPVVAPKCRPSPPTPPWHSKPALKSRNSYPGCCAVHTPPNRAVKAGLWRGGLDGSPLCQPS